MEEVETVQHFMDRVCDLEPSEVTADDWATLLAIALVGAQTIVKEEGANAPIPSDH